MKVRSNLYRKESYYGYLFVLAPVVGYLLFTMYPLLYSLYGSFTDWDGLGQMTFIGLDNFKDILADELFYKASFNTIFMMIGIPIEITLALLLAMGLNRKMFGTTTFRVIYYVRLFLHSRLYRFCGSGPITATMVW